MKGRLGDRPELALVLCDDVARFTYVIRSASAHQQFDQHSDGITHVKCVSSGNFGMNHGPQCFDCLIAPTLPRQFRGHLSIGKPTADIDAPRARLVQ